MKSEKDYIEWFKWMYNINPYHTIHGIRYVDAYVAMRDEYNGLMGETDLVVMLKKEGTLSFEKNRKKIMKEFAILTFDEYSQKRGWGDFFLSRHFFYIT